MKFNYFGNCRELTNISDASPMERSVTRGYTVHTENRLLFSIQSDFRYFASTEEEYFLRFMGNLKDKRDIQEEMSKVS